MRSNSGAALGVINTLSDEVPVVGRRNSTSGRLRRSPRALEPYRVCRRLPLLRGWSHDEANPTLFP